MDGRLTKYPQSYKYSREEVVSVVGVVPSMIKCTQFVLQPSSSSSSSFHLGLQTTQWKSNPPRSVEVPGPNVFSSAPPPSSRTIRPLQHPAAVVSRARTLSSYSSLIQSCIDSHSFAAGKLIHSQMVAAGVLPDAYLQTKILMLYARSGEPADLHAARKFFDEMTDRNSSSWNTVILAYARAGEHLEVLRLFPRMLADGNTPDKFTFPSVLKACASRSGEDAISQVHSLIVKHGWARNDVVGRMLVDGYSTFGFVDDAVNAFNGIEGVNVAAWNALISTYVGSMMWEEVWRAFCDMQDRKASPDHSTFAMAIKACSALRSVEKGKQLHSKVVVSGYAFDVYVCNSLIDMYAKCGDIESCELVFDLMADRSQVSWNSMISNYAHLGHYEDALFTFLQMREVGYDADMFNLGSGLMACAGMADVQVGKAFHGYLIRRSLDSDVVLGSAVVDMYAKCGCMKEAHHAFHRMEERNLISWNALIAGYVQAGDVDPTIDLYYALEQAYIKPDQYTFASLLSLSSDIRNVKLGKEIHAYVVKMVPKSNIVLETELVHMYAKCGRLSDAENIFRRMPRRNAYSWNSLIEGYEKDDRCDAVLKVFCEMQLSGLVPDCFSLSIALSAIASSSVPSQGMQVHGFMVKRMLDNDNVLCCKLIEMYTKWGKLDYACRIYNKATEKDLTLCNEMLSAVIKHGNMGVARMLFDEMKERDIISWNLMLIGYVKGNFENEALNTFQDMILEVHDYDFSTLVPIFSLCANIPVREMGKQLHACTIKKGLVNNSVVLDSAIVDMYSKVGSIEEARKYFDKMKDKNVQTWNTMISGYSNHGLSRQVFNLYEQMRKENIHPNSVTFLSVLSVCSHTGLVEEGINAFISMEEHGVEARLEHYNCMVDIFGRAGLLDKAKEFIEKMSIQPDVSTWVALLGASRIHRNADIGKFAAEKLFQLDPGNPGHYRLMANIYAAAGMWEEVDKVRDLMRANRAMSEPGTSWIEIGNSMQPFHAGDMTHPRTEDICSTLKCLSSCMRLYLEPAY